MPALALLAAVQDTLAAVPTAPPTPLETVMLAEDKLYVVLMVVLIIWFGLLFFLFRTDRKLDALERELEARIPTETTPPRAPNSDLT